MVKNEHQTQEMSKRAFCFGFHPWKLAYVRKYLAGRPVVYARSALWARVRGFDDQCAAIVWGMRDSEEVRALAQRHGVPIWRMEDGFLRSVGLGSDRFEPASLVLDRTGIYYDPTRPSDLETILQSGVFEMSAVERARTLRESVVRSGVSKYNVGDRSVPLPEVPPGRRVVLVPGQVEDDASIRLGCRDIRTNVELLEATRAERPDAFILFKPHPDVVSGNRRGAVSDADARRLADAVVLDAPLPACLAIAHEVYTLTSLVGFEALLRGLEVTVLGQPFYAGWGLTRDRHPHPRRTRRLTLDELVCGALIRYPLYLDATTGRLTTPEAAVTTLQQQISRAGNQPVRIGWLRRKAKKARNALRGVLDAF